MGKEGTPEIRMSRRIQRQKPWSLNFQERK
jgi:hypothetical protein